MKDGVKYICAGISCLLFVSISWPVTVVYNLRIAEITRRQAHELKNIKPYIAALNMFNQHRETYNHIHQNFFGQLASLIYLNHKFFVKADFAFAHASSKFHEFHFSRTQTDDLLFTAGYGVQMTKRAKSTFSGLFGIPLHKDLGLEGVQFGTGHFGIGIQWDGSFIIAKHPNHAIYSAVRFVQFLPRNIDFELIPVANRFRFTPGSVSDLLVAYNVRCGKQRVEVGYNATFLYNAHIRPHVQFIIDQVHFIRSSFYASWGHIMTIKNHVSGISLSLSYSFDHTPKDFGIKRGVTLWGLWGINF